MTGMVVSKKDFLRFEQRACQLTHRIDYEYIVIYIRDFCCKFSHYSEAWLRYNVKYSVLCYFFTSGLSSKCMKLSPEKNLTAACCTSDTEIPLIRAACFSSCKRSSPFSSCVPKYPNHQLFVFSCTSRAFLSPAFHLSRLPAGGPTVFRCWISSSTDAISLSALAGAQVKLTTKPY